MKQSNLRCKTTSIEDCSVAYVLGAAIW